MVRAPKRAPHAVGDITLFLKFVQALLEKKGITGGHPCSMRIDQHRRMGVGEGLKDEIGSLARAWYLITIVSALITTSID